VEVKAKKIDKIKFMLALKCCNKCKFLGAVMNVNSAVMRQKQVTEI